MIKLKSLMLEVLERIGEDPDEVSSDMPIDWDKPDIQVLKKWDVNSIREFSVLPKTFVAIYPSILDVNDLDAKFSEEELEFGNEGYEWDDFKRNKGGFPPIVVRRDEYDYILIMDGNHRVKWAQEVGYKTIGAWVVDELIQKEIDKRK